MTEQRKDQNFDGGETQTASNPTTSTTGSDVAENTATANDDFGGVPRTEEVSTDLEDDDL